MGLHLNHICGCPRTSAECAAMSRPPALPTASRIPLIWSSWLLIVLAPLALANVQAQVPTYADPTAPIEARISSLIASMTLDEKIQALGSDPSIPRLGLRLSGHIEGLHGVALGGPGAWGRISNPDGTVRNEPVPT